MIGLTYLLRGEPVVVLARWRNPDRETLEAALRSLCGTRPSCAPRNVLLRLPDGTLTVRPFRGLRRV